MKKIQEVLSSKALLARGKDFDKVVMTRARRLGALARASNPYAFNIPGDPDPKKIEKAKKILAAVRESIRSIDEMKTQVDSNTADVRHKRMIRQFDVRESIMPFDIVLNFLLEKKSFNFKAKHKNPNGGLNAAGRAAYNRATGGNLKPPQPEGGPRRDSFCARMKGMKRKLTSVATANDPNSRINKSLRAWKC
jgi:hypothetical protein